MEPARGHLKQGSGVTRHFVCSCPAPQHPAECHLPETLELLANLQLRPSACVLTHVPGLCLQRCRSHNTLGFMVLCEGCDKVTCGELWHTGSPT